MIDIIQKGKMRYYRIALLIPTLFWIFFSNVHADIADKLPQSILNHFNLIQRSPIAPDLRNAINTINGLSLERQESALVSLAPDTTGGIYYANRIGIDGFFKRIESRLEFIGLRSNPYIQFGYSAGDYSNQCLSNNLTPIFLSGTQKQLPKHGFLGYRSTTWGVGVIGDAVLIDHIGIDSDRLRVGGGLTFANSASRIERSLDKKTMVDTEQAIVYGIYEHCNMFLDGIFGMGLNQFEVKRNIQIGDTINRNTKASYNGFQFAGRVKTGLVVPSCLVELTPSVALQYSYLHHEGYTEKDAFGLGLSVKAKQYTALDAEIGIKAAYVQDRDSFLPEIHAYYLREIRSPKFSLTTQFIGGGGQFVVPGARAHPDHINFGASIGTEIIRYLTVVANYDFETDMEYFSSSKHKYQKHIIALRARYEF